MYCSNCGTHLPDDARFCIICGGVIAATGGTERLSAPTQSFTKAPFTPHIRELAQRLATAYPDLRLDSFGVRVDDGKLTLMVDLSMTLEHPINDTATINEFLDWREKQQLLAAWQASTTPHSRPPR